MADLVRKQIRDRVVTVLTGLTTTGARVFPFRMKPWNNADLPGLAIYTQQESNEIDSLSYPRRKLHELDLIVEVALKANNAAEDTIDLICKEILIAMEADPTLNNLSKDCFLVNTEIEFSPESEKETLNAKLNFRVFYSTREAVPDATA